MAAHDDNRCCHDDLPAHCPTCDPHRSPYESHPMPAWFRDTYRRFKTRGHTP